MIRVSHQHQHQQQQRQAKQQAPARQAAARGGLTFTPDGQFLLAATSDGSVDAWSMGTRSLQARWAQRHSGIEEDGLGGAGAGGGGEGGRVGGKEQGGDGDGDAAPVRWGSGVGGDGAIASGCLRCHPRCDVVASAAGTSVCLWQPA